jgi:hypothetical protein
MPADSNRIVVLFEGFDIHEYMRVNRRYGQVTLYYENGQVTYVKKEETFRKNGNNRKGGRK